MTDQRMEKIVAILLRTGVMIAAAVVLAGGVGYLIQHAHEQPAYHTFHGEPEKFRTLPGIAAAAAHFDWQGVIQFGLLLLIATPIARVAFALVAFAMEKDRVYMIVTTIVLLVLLYSLIATHR
jgi:uncharacterized membrane protein